MPELSDISRSILLVNDHGANTGIGTYFNQLHHNLLQITSEEYSYHLLMQNMGESFVASMPDTVVQYRPSWAKQHGFGKMYSVTSYFYFPKRIPHSFSLYHISSQMMGRSLKYISPAIVTCHDLIAFKVKANHPAFTEHMRRKHLAELRRAAAIIFISRHTRDDFLSLFDYQEEDTAVIHHAAGDHFQPRDKMSSRKALKLPTDRPIILHVGSEAPRKNIITLLQALHKIKQQIPEILFIRIGSQGRRSRELTASLRLEENIRYFKNQPEEKLAKFYNAADVFVFPSTYEGFGLPALEALKSGCPLIASYATSIPEITGDAAILHDPNDMDGFAGSIEAMLNDNALREAYYKRGIERATHFSWVKTAGQTLELYQKVLES